MWLVCVWCRQVSGKDNTLSSELAPGRKCTYKGRQKFWHGARYATHLKSTRRITRPASRAPGASHDPPHAHQAHKGNSHQGARRVMWPTSSAPGASRDPPHEHQVHHMTRLTRTKRIRGTASGTQLQATVCHIPVTSSPREQECCLRRQLAITRLENFIVGNIKYEIHLGISETFGRHKILSERKI